MIVSPNNCIVNSFGAGVIVLSTALYVDETFGLISKRSSSFPDITSTLRGPKINRKSYVLEMSKDYDSTDDLR